MIIQRLSSALRRQDWSQIVIEILIVIIGIFLGLQVQAWYEDRAERERERVYLERIHSDIMSLDEYQATLNEIRFADRLRNTFYQNLTEVIDYVGGHNRNIELGSQHCTAVILSHTYSAMASNSLATLNELISSGQLSIFQNDDIKIAISDYLTTADYMSNQLEHLNAVALVLARKYPELIQWNIAPGGSVFREARAHTCDFDSMAKNKAFINDLADNHVKQTASRTSQDLQFERLTRVHVLVDAELAITHREERQ